MSELTGKVTAGLPSLTAQLRHERDIILRTRHEAEVNLRTEATRAEASVAKDGEIDTTDARAQIGHPLSCQQFIQRLSKINGNLIFERSKCNPEIMGIYVMVNKYDPLFMTNKYEKQFICGFESGYSPEHSIRHYKEKQIPDPNNFGNWITVREFTRETRGWRTVLMRLLRMRLITEPQIRKHFNFSRESANWKALTN